MPSRGGLTAEEVREAVALAARTIPVVAAGIASFDPDYDADRRMLDTALTLLPILAAASR